MLLKALVKTPFGPVNIMTTHLSLSKAARYSFCRDYYEIFWVLTTFIFILFSFKWRLFVIRTRTLLEIGRYSLSLKPSRAVLVGDFNEDEMSFTDNLQGKFGFEDVWTKLKPSQQNRTPSFTFNSWYERMPSFTLKTNFLGRDLRSRIDYILSRGLLPETISTEAKESIAVSSLKAQAGVSDTKDTLHASDHLFLLAYFRPDPADSLSAKPNH